MTELKEKSFEQKKKAVVLESFFQWEGYTASTEETENHYVVSLENPKVSGKRAQIVIGQAKKMEKLWMRLDLVVSGDVVSKGTFDESETDFQAIDTFLK